MSFKLFYAPYAFFSTTHPVLQNFDKNRDPELNSQVETLSYSELSSVPHDDEGNGISPHDPPRTKDQFGRKAHGIGRAAQTSIASPNQLTDVCPIKGPSLSLTVERRPSRGQFGHWVIFCEESEGIYRMSKERVSLKRTLCANGR